MGRRLSTEAGAQLGLALAAGRKDQRNGSYRRGLLTSMGHLEVAVLRTRASGSAEAVLGRYKRRGDASVHG
ncbi:hypothetical protein GTY96_26740 [Corallococcus sp. c25j21]|uniref:transposase n=1 Tax=Corallococcus silvisoli TaxID=2697031 RepID=UPI001377ED70|nr:transposase [Corallococcus silvisoli]NBD12562.1 hypothetical protein [Corallococcus silvisoli]